MSVYDELRYNDLLSKYFDEPLSQISQILNFVFTYTQYTVPFKNELVVIRVTLSKKRNVLCTENGVVLNPVLLGVLLSRHALRETKAAEYEDT